MLNNCDFLTKKFNELGGPILHNAENDCEHFDPIAVARLNRITDATGAKLVLSSSWRLLRPFTDMVGLLKFVGVTGELIDKTCSNREVSKELINAHPEFAAKRFHRGFEIAQWIAKHNFTGKFIILDDSSDMVFLIDRLIKTEWLTGLQDEQVDKAISVLNS